MSRHGITSRVAVPMVAQPWSTTLGVASPKKQKRFTFIGHYPGYRAAKQKANQLASGRAGIHSRKTAQSFLGALQSPATSNVVFDGPGEPDANGIPPDAQIAAGPNYVVVAINSLIAIYDKTGALQGSFQQLSSFFSSLGVAGEIYDPRIIYDQADNRFILSAADVNFSTFGSGDVVLAVSATSDPTGLWYKYALNFMGQSLYNGGNTFPDFPTLGLSSSAVYVSTGQFALSTTCVEYNTCSFSDTWIKVIGLPGLLAGSSTLTTTTFKNVKTAGGDPAFTIEPATTYGSAPGEFLVAAAYTANPGTALNVFEISTSGTPTLSSADLTVPNFSMPPDATQPETGNPIATNDFRLLNAVWAGKSLWCGQNVQNSSGSGVAARWYQISAASLSTLSLAQTGDVAGSGDAYFPSLEVNSNADVGMVFTTSSASQFASAAFTGRSASDPPNTMRTFTIYRQGTDNYIDQAVRWGDYSGISPDPDGSSFWTIAEYAGSPDPHFGTAIALATGVPALNLSTLTLDFGSDTVNVASAPLTLTITNSSANSVTLGTAGITGPDAADFSTSQDGCSNVTLAPSGTCTLSLVFTPDSIGTKNAVLEIGTSPGGLPQQVYLTGVGAAATAGISVSPDSLTFSGTPAHTVSAPQVVQVTNTSTSSEALEIGVDIPFTQTNNCGTALPAGQVCQISVVYRPSHASAAGSGGPDSAYLDITYVGFPSGVPSPSVTLTGVPTTAPLVTICPTALDFGNQTVGTASSPQTVTINNSGTSDMTISSIGVSGDFSETSTCGGLPATLAAETACTVSITFTPKTAGAETGTLTVTDNATGTTPAVPLTGTGVASSAQLYPLIREPRRVFAGGHQSEPSASTVSSPSTRSSRLALRRYGNLPLSFEANLGQSDSQVKFLSRGKSYVLFLTSDEAVLKLTCLKPRKTRKKTRNGGQAGATRSDLAASVVGIRMVGVNGKAPIEGLDELPGKVNYLIGNDPSKWKTGLPLYARVRYRDIYPGTDLVYYGNRHRLEYDFVVSPGADSRDIRLDFKGASRIRVAGNGDLVLTTGAGKLRFCKPVVYQQGARIAAKPSRVAASFRSAREGARRSALVYRKYVDGRYVLRAIQNPKSKIRSYEVSFRLGHYDHSKPLVIDPVLSYSTYLGGSAADVADAIAVDASGDAYVAGMTSSANFPIANALQTAINKTLPYSTDAFITKLSADGTSLMYSTYLGGSTDEGAQGVAVDSQGNAYVAGWTSSTDFPITPGAFQTLYRGSSPLGTTGFLAKLNSTGSSLIYSTYFGGTGGEIIEALAVDSSGDAYIGGTTNSTDLPTTPGSFQPKFTGGQASASPWPCGGLETVDHGDCIDGFVAEVNPQGTGLVYGTYLGGSRLNGVMGVAVDTAGDAYVTGTTDSYDFPTTPGAYQTWYYGSPNASFVAKIKPGGTALAYSTYLGPTGPSNATFENEDFATANGIAVDNQGAAYVVGSTGSNEFPEVDPFQTKQYVTDGVYQWGFVTKVHPAGCALSYSTLLGGRQYNSANAVAVDSSGDAYVTGWTDDFNFPTLNPFQASYTQTPGIGTLHSQAFVTEFAPSGSTLIYSSYLGGTTTDLPPTHGGGDFGNAIAVDSSGNAYVAGQTDSTDFPTVSAADPTYGGSKDGFVTKVAPTVVPSITLSPTSLTFPSTPVGTDSAPMTVTVTNTTSSPVDVNSITIPYFTTLFAVSSDACTTTLQPGASCTFGVISTPVNTGSYEGVAMVNDNAFAGPHHVLLNGTGFTPPTLQIRPNQGTTEDMGSVPVGSPSVVNTLSVLNSGSQPLTITSVAVTGDFSETNNCTSSLGFDQSCDINLVFTPTASGTRTGTLTVMSNTQNDQVTIPLTGIGEDFTVGTSSGTSSSATVAAGQTATYNLSLGSTTGFQQFISLTCSGAPAGSTCSVNPASMSVPGTATVTVTTTARSAAPGTFRFDLPPVLSRGPWSSLGSLLCLCLAGLAGLFVLKLRQPRGVQIGIAVVLFATLLLVSCGGGGGASPSGGGGGNNPGTPAGTYSLTVTGNYTNPGDSTPSLTHTTTLTLTVQ